MCQNNLLTCLKRIFFIKIFFDLFKTKLEEKNVIIRSIKGLYKYWIMAQEKGLKYVNIVYMICMYNHVWINVVTEACVLVWVFNTSWMHINTDIRAHHTTKLE